MLLWAWKFVLKAPSCHWNSCLFHRIPGAVWSITWWGSQESHWGQNPFRYPAQASGVGGLSLQSQDAFANPFKQVFSVRGSWLEIHTCAACSFLLLITEVSAGGSSFRSCATNMTLNSLVKRALLGNTKQKIDKSNESFIRGFMPVSHCLQNLWSSPVLERWDKCPCGRAQFRRSSLFCVLLTASLSWCGVSELNLDNSNLDCYSPSTSITIWLPSKLAREAPDSSRWLGRPASRVISVSFLSR